MEKQGERGHRLVLIPAPFQGHINPMLQLGAILHSKGFSITIAHPQYYSPAPASHPHFTFLPIPETLSDPDVAGGDDMALVLITNVNCKEPLCKLLMEQQQQQEKLGHDEIVGIIYDGFMYFAQAVGNHLKVPSIVFYTHGVGAGLVYSAILQLHAKGCIPPPQDFKSSDMVPGLHPIRFMDLPMLNVLENSKDALLQVIANVFNIRSTSAMIWNTMDWLDGPVLEELQQQFQRPQFPLGPLHKFTRARPSSTLEEDKNCIAWLDKQTHNSVIYVSMGSIASTNEKDLAEMAWGLANCKQPFLWVVRPGSVHGSKWIELLPEGFEKIVGERGCVVKWAPQKEVLAHGAIGGFWSHCGWNSSLESICEGVPMICQPCFGDQTINARYLSHVWKIGLELEINDYKLERGDITRAIKRLMVDKEGEEMRQRAKELKEKATLTIKEGGSSYKSFNDLKEFILSF